MIADAPVTQEELVSREIERIAKTVPGVDDVLVQVRRLASQD